MFVNTSDDSDIKIAPDFGTGNALSVKNEEETEESVYEYSIHKKNGNMDKAHILGQKLMDSFFECNVPGISETELYNRYFLFTFAADICTEDHCPALLVSQTAFNVFLDNIRSASPDIYERIVKSTPYSLYLLASRKSRYDASEYGKIFAELLELPSDEATIKSIAALYNDYYDLCCRHIKECQFVSA